MLLSRSTTEQNFLPATGRSLQSRPRARGLSGNALQLRDPGDELRRIQIKQRNMRMIGEIAAVANLVAGERNGDPVS